MTDLTEQWKKGELPSGRYYTIVSGGSYEDYSFIDYYNEYSGDFEKHPMITKEVLAPVPSYEEWMATRGTAQFLMDKNKQLKELLKECQSKLNYCTRETYELQTKINQALGEE